MAGPWEKYGNGQQPGVIPLGSPDPAQVYKGPAAQANLVGQNLSNVHTQQQIAAQPVQQQGQILSNERTAQSTQFDRAAAASDLAGKFAKDQRVVEYRTVLPQVAAAMAADPGKQGDLTVVYAWAKAMDPQGSVREGDTDMATSSSSYVQQAFQYVARINQGKGLPPEVRRGLVNEMRTKAAVLNQAYTEARHQYRALAEQGNIPAKTIIGDHDGDKYQAIESRFLKRPVRNGPPSAVPTSGPTATSLDQNRTSQLDSFIKRGAPFLEASKWVREQGGDPISPTAYRQAVQFAKANPNYSGSLAEFTVTKPTTPAQQFLGGIGDFGSARDVGLFKGAKESLDRAAVGAQTAFNAIPGVADSDSATQAQGASQGFFADKASDPRYETAGRLAGATLLSAPLTNPYLAGAAGNLLMTDSTGMGAAGDAAIGAVGGKIADLGLRGLSGVIAPVGRDAMRRLSREGVRFSPGQMIGGRARGLEDRLTANPVLGPQIGAIREQGLEAANRIPANRALGAIGQQLPENVPAGHEAVAYTKNALGDFYDNTLNGKTIGLDPTYITRLNTLGQRSNLRPEEFGKGADIIQREVSGAFQEPGTPLGSMSGVTFKKLDSRLGRLGQDFKQSNNIFERDIGDLLLDVKDQTRALARRQNPGMGADLRAADEGYANFKILERAAAANPATGIFGPGQLRTAIRQADRSVGKGATARGEARMQDLASDMSEAMPSTVGSSGTSEREQVNKLAPWIIGSLLSPLYSKPAEKMLAGTLLREPGIASRRTSDLLRRLPRGMFGPLIPYGVDPGSGY